MALVTINLPDELHRALKAAAARTGRTIGSMVAESLEAYGIKSRADAAALVQQARERARLSEDEALELSVRETAEHRTSLHRVPLIDRSGATDHDVTIRLGCQVEPLATNGLVKLEVGCFIAPSSKGRFAVFAGG